MPFLPISQNHRLLVLLTVISASIILPPFLDKSFGTPVFFDTLNTAILIATVFALSRNRSYLVISTILVLPLLFAIWASKSIGHSWAVMPGLVSGILFFIYTAYQILRVVLANETVTPEVIAGSVAVYLLLGFTCALMYGLLNTVTPGSFIHSSSDQPIEAYSYIYFSFITLTTLGYGDILPMTNIARCITLVEAVIGQIYLVVLVAWLVGMFSSEYRSRYKRRLVVSTNE